MSAFSPPESILDAWDLPKSLDFPLYAAIFHVLGVWNNFFAALVFINSEKDRALQMAASVFRGFFGANYHYLLDGVVLSGWALPGFSCGLAHNEGRFDQQALVDLFRR